MNSKTPKATIWNRTFICVLLANISLSFSMFLVNPFVAGYARDILGASESLMGLIASIYFGTAILMRPFSGPAITKYNKKMLLILSYGIGLSVNIGYAFANSIGMFIFFRCLHGIQFSIIGSLNMTIASNALPKEKIASGLSLLGIGGAVSTLLGPSISLALNGYYSQTYGPRYGFAAIFIASAAIQGLALIPCALVDVPKPTSKELASLGSWHKNMFSKECLMPTAVTVFFAMVTTLYGTFITEYAKTLGIGNEISTYFMVSAIGTVIFRPLVGQLMDKFSIIKIVIPAILISASSLIITYFAKGMVNLWFVALLNSVAMAGVQPALQAMCIRSVPTIRRGVASNTTYLGLDLGNFMGPAIGGVIIANFGYSSMFLLGLIPLAICIVIFTTGWKNYVARANQVEAESARADVVKNSGMVSQKA